MNEKLYAKPTSNDTENEFVGPNLQRYSLSKLYALRNIGNSQRRPELRAELQTLSFLKFNNGGQAGSVNENVGGDSEAISMRPQRQMNIRDRPMSFTRSGPGRIDNVMSISNIAPKASFLDQRSNSIAHLMPAFAKKRIEAAAAASQQNNGGASSNCEDIEGSRSGTRTDHSNVNINCTKGLSKFQPTMRSTSPRRSMGRHLSNENDDFLSNLSSPNARHERRIGSGRLLHREASWDYHDKNSAPMQKHTGSNSRYSERSNAPPTPSRGFDRRNNSSGGGGDATISHNNMRRLNTDEQRPQRRTFGDRNDEPEWFSGGPTSQNDTIELRGFDDPLESSDHSEQRQRPENDHKDICFSDSLDEEEREMKRSSSYHSVEASLEDQRKHNEREVEPNEQKHKEFNFDAFLNLDPLDPELMRSDNCNQQEMLPIGGSRFKRWFATKDKCEETVQSNESKIGPETQRPQNILLEFIQHTKTPNASEHGHLQRLEMPSVEELEARMRKIDVKENDDSRNAKGTEPDQQKFQPAAPDMEAFKKLLEQLNNVDGNREQLRSNCMPALPNAPNMGMVPPAHHLGIFPTGNIQVQQPPSQLVSMNPVAGRPPQSQTASLNTERISQMQQQQQQQQQMQQQQFPLIGPHPPLPPALIAEAEQKRREFVNLLHAVNRGQVPLVFLEKELNNPITPPHTKEIISAVLREATRSMTPSIGQLPPPVQLMRTSPIHHQQDMHSPIPMMNVIAHPQPNRDMIPGVTPPIGMQGPNPQELHIRTQAIFQNAMLKKKMEEQLQHQQQQQQQEALNRRSEVHKAQEDANQPQLYQASQSQRSTPTGGQNRSLNSPTPLAFTPTSVLRKMTAEKDNNLGSQQHQQPKPQAQAQMQNKAFQHPQQLTNSLPPQQLPRMILGGGNNTAPPQQNQLVNSPMSPQAVPSLHQQQRMPPSDLKWQAMNMVLNQPGPSNVGVYGNVAPPLPLPAPLQKPMGRPILKGPPPSLPQMSQQQQPQVPSMMFSPTNKIDQQQHQQRLKNNQTPQHMFNQNQQQMQQGFASPSHMQPTTSAPQAMLHMQQHQPSQPQMFQMHQMSVQQQQQMQLQRQLHQHHHPQQRESASNQGTGNSILNNTNADNMTSNNSGGSLVNNARDGGLSPTSNQLAQWFSPELLAQASAGKLPQINVNQALSLEEFERNIQQHSSIVHN